MVIVLVKWNRYCVGLHVKRNDFHIHMMWFYVNNQDDFACERDPYCLGLHMKKENDLHPHIMWYNSYNQL